jgi:hypothetical protein
MKTYLPCITLAAVLGSLHLAGAADITGKVTLKGTPKPEIPIQLDATCGKTAGQTCHHAPLRGGADKGLANVFVYIKQGAQKAPATGEGPLLDQVGCMYEPYVLGVVTGQKLKIRNSDPLLHNVHATTKPGANKEFNFAQVSKGQVNEKAFEPRKSWCA